MSLDKFRFEMSGESYSPKEQALLDIVMNSSSNWSVGEAMEELAKMGSARVLSEIVNKSNSQWCVGEAMKALRKRDFK